MSDEIWAQGISNNFPFPIKKNDHILKSNLIKFKIGFQKNEKGFNLVYEVTQTE